MDGQLGEYVLLEKLGEGATGTVWRARRKGDDHDIALKQLKEISSDKCMRFAREVQFTSQLKHPNIAQAFGASATNGKWYYTMQLVRGARRLDDYATNASRAHVLLLMEKICRAVQYAQKIGIIHRDLKPSNILVDESGEPFVVDFGLARSWEPEAPDVTQDLRFVGTLA